MHTEVLIDSFHNDLRAAVVENGKLVELYLSNKQTEQSAGDIYKGTVDAVLPGIQSAFIDVGHERKGYLHISDIVTTGFENLSRDFGSDEMNGRTPGRHDDIGDILRPGQGLLVQVQKESIGDKGAKLTTNISIPGRLLVLMPFQNRIFVSNRITDGENRNRLKMLVADMIPDNTGAIVRTAAESAEEGDIEEDLRRLISLWERISDKGDKSRAPNLIYEEKDLLKRIIRDVFTEEVNILIVDSLELYEKAQSVVEPISPNLANRIRFFEDNTPIFDAFGIENEIERIFRRKIWLRSGGYIVIEETEALTSIDVNTGRFLGREDMEATILKTNMEAATEIARQLRLRNTGGIIIIDFIDMANAENRTALMRQFNEYLRRDRSRTKVCELSALGMIEMTRQRTRESITSVLSRQCPYCNGRGYVLTLEAMADRVEREIERVFQNRSERDISVLLNPHVKKFIEEVLGRRFHDLELKHSGNISLDARQEIPLDGIEILNILGRNLNN
ncbi:MAG: Rne/Rng family ribonuclease [bacterium]|nr:Rne/Rng family ribonuclease [bacterium]